MKKQYALLLALALPLCLPQPAAAQFEDIPAAMAGDLGGTDRGDYFWKREELDFGNDPYTAVCLNGRYVRSLRGFNQEIMAAVPLHHPLGNREYVTFKQLLKYPLIAYSKQSGLRQTIVKMLNSESLKPKIKIEAIEDHTIIGFVHWDFGVAIIPHLPQIADNQVKLLHIDTKKNWHELFAITKNNHFMTPTVSLFFDFVCKYCKENYLDKNILI